MGFNDINIKVSGGSDIISTLQTYTTRILKPNIVDGKNVLTQEMLSSKNTKYVIKYNYELLDATLTMPQNVILEFDGGSIKNGTLVGNDTLMLNTNETESVLYNVTLDGTWKESSYDLVEEVVADKAPGDGMGRIILRKDKTFAEQLTQENTIYVIRYDFELDENITIPANCVLQFEGGSISGEHTITGQNTGIEAGLVKIFGTNVTLGGSWNVAEAYPEWFGAKGDGVTDDTDCISDLFKVFSCAYFSPDKVYCIKKQLSIDGSFTICGNGFSSIIRISDNGAIKCDDNHFNTIDIHNLRIENYLDTGYALYFKKYEEVNPPKPILDAIPNLSLENVYFYHRNNAHVDIDSVTIFLHGIREGNITNCYFKGDGTLCGTSIELTGNAPSKGKKYNTANINIANCHFTWANTFIYAHAETGADAPYMDGLRIINCSFLGAKYGINCVHNDTIFISKCMIDGPENPIKAYNCGNVWIENNYIQSKKSDAKLIDIIFDIPGVISRAGDKVLNNYLYSAVDVTLNVIGISIVNTTVRHSMVDVCGNTFMRLDKAMYLKGCYQTTINDNGCRFCNLFIGASATNVLLLDGNRVDANVPAFFSSINEGNTYVSENNVWGNKKACIHQRIKCIGNGLNKNFGYNFKNYLFKSSAVFKSAVVEDNRENLGVYRLGVDTSNNQAKYIVMFENPPADGITFYIDFTIICYGGVDRDSDLSDK